MKFHLNSNIIEGTPDEILEYTELLRNKGKDNEEEAMRQDMLFGI